MRRTPRGKTARGVVDATLASGEHVDPFTGQPPNFDVLERGPLAYGSLIEDYLFWMHLPSGEFYRPGFVNYVRAWPQRNGRGPEAYVVRFELWWLSWVAPPPGSTEPGPMRRELILSGH